MTSAGEPVTPGTDRPRVALTMLTYVPGGMGGSETYARALTRELAGSTRVEATAFVARGAEGLSEGVPERVVPSVVAGAGTSSRLRTLARGTIDRRRILRLMAGVDVVHAPFTVPLPQPAAGTPFVTTLHDVQHLELPELFTRAERLYRRRYYDAAARRADAVITVSETSRRSIVERLGIPATRVHVAPLAVDHRRFTPSTAPREPFVLYPARAWPHKNHARLVEAVALLRRDRPDLRLVLTGGGLEALGPLPEWVDRRGLVSGDELVRLYATAGALAFPSLYEGFGMPPLEAMASACTVAASDVGAVREVCGDAAVLFDPHDPVAIAAGVAAALDAGDQLRTAGVARAAEFTWARCAAVHERVYLDVSRAAHG